MSGIQACALGEALIHVGRRRCLRETEIARRITHQDFGTPLRPTPTFRSALSKPAAPTDMVVGSPALPENTMHPSGSLVVLTSGNRTEE